MAIRLVVVGDVVLDEDFTGEIERVSTEAPVPVVANPRRASGPGGAGLAALLAVAEGHEVTVVTALAEDEPGRQALAQLRAAGVTVVNLGSPAPTVVKTRIRARDQTVLVLERSASAGTPGPLPAAGRDALAAAAAILVSDYGFGVAGSPDLRAALSTVVGPVPVVWDPHPRGAAPVPGCTVATPNRREAALLAPGPAAAGLAGDIERARRLLRDWGVGQVVVTRDRAGAVLVREAPVPPLALPVPPVAGADARGAGDRFAVAVAVHLGRGALVPEAVAEATRDATAFVAAGCGRPGRPERPGDGAPGTGAGEGSGDGGPGSGDGAAAIELAARVRAAGGTVVATGGCFDLLHRGHVALLAQARQLGDCLIVCLNGDASVTRLKGDPRPLVTAADRAGVLRALSPVDAVVVFEEDTPAEVLNRLRPDIYVKGGDYAIGDIPERTAVEAGGGQVMLVPYLDGRSTTALLRRAAERRA